MNMELIAVGVICLLVGYVIGVTAVRLAMRRAVRDRLSQLLVLIEQEGGQVISITEVEEGDAKSEDSYVLKCEVHHGAFYFFEADTDKFICQGNTIEEAYENYLARGIKRDAEFTHNDTTQYFKFEQ